MTVGDFNVQPTKIPCLLKGITAGLWVDLEAAWAGLSLLLPVSAPGPTGSNREDELSFCYCCG